MATSEKLKFYERLAPAAMEQQIKYGIPASVTLAQAWIEHGKYSETSNNYFGIHDDDGYWRRNGGKTVVLNDHGTMAHFRVYDSMEQGIEDHSRFFFRKNSRYSAAHGISSNDEKFAEKWAYVICRAGYAERPKNDPDRYARSIMGEINGYDLTRFDRQANVLASQRGLTVGYLRGNSASPMQVSASPGYAQADVQHGAGSIVSNSYCFPIAVDNLVMSDGFGKKATGYRDHTHNGIDLRAKYQDVLATEHGKVFSTGSNSLSGNFVVMEYERSDGSKWHVSYCHLDKITVSKDDVLDAGAKLGVSGNTGNSTGPHLHLTVKHLDPGQPETEYKAVDPLGYLAEIAVRGNLQGTVLKKGTNEDLLASLKGSVDTTPTPYDTELAQHQNTNLTDEQLHNAEEGALLAEATGSNDPKNMLAYLLGMNGDQASQGGDLFSSIISGLFMAAIGMAMSLDHGGNDQALAVDDTRRVAPAENDDYSVVKRQREAVDPNRAHELAMMNFDAEYPEEHQGTGQRLA